MSGVETFSIIVTSITPILVAVLALIQAKNEKSNARYRKTCEENEKLRKEASEKEKKEHEDRLQRMEDNISDMKDEIKTLQRTINIQEVERQLSQLHMMTELNFGYIQSLSDTIIVLGDALAASSSIDNEAKERLEQAISENRSKEDQLVKDLLTIVS